MWSPWLTITCEQLRSIRQPDHASNEFPPPVPDDPQPGCEIILRASRRNGQRQMYASGAALVNSA